MRLMRGPLVQGLFVCCLTGTNAQSTVYVTHKSETLSVAYVKASSGSGKQVTDAVSTGSDESLEKEVDDSLLVESLEKKRLMKYSLVESMRNKSLMRDPLVPM